VKIKHNHDDDIEECGPERMAMLCILSNGLHGDSFQKKVSFQK
jgi:hypothetical protein